jgi:PAS domain S-box-containing protein
MGGLSVAGVGPFRILFVESRPAEVELAERELRSGGIDLVSRRVDTREDFLEALASFAPDLVISDYGPPFLQAQAALELARTADPLMPFIVIASSASVDTAVKCLKAGACDFVTKERIARLPDAVKEAVGRREARKREIERAARLEESEARYRALFENSHVAMLLIDPEDGSIVLANDAACEFYGRKREALIGMKLGRINELGDEAIAPIINEVLSRRRRHFEFRYGIPDGLFRDVEVHSDLISLGNKLFSFSIVRDVSTRVSAERDRDELASRLSRYLSTSPAITYSLRIKDGTVAWLWASENVETILGYTPEEALVPDWWVRNIHSADRMRALRWIADLMEARTGGQEYRFWRKDRTVVWLHDEARFSPGSGGDSEVIGTLTDVSDRKRVEADLSLKSAALEAAANAIVITDRDGAIVWANKAFETISGYSREEAVGRNPRDLIKSGRHDAAFYRGLWDTILSGQVWRDQIVNRAKDGRLYTEEMTITPVLDEVSRVSSFIAIKSDVTEREESRRRLETSLAEKEEFLRQTHHRIHNSMQLITSLLQLSARGFEDERLHSAIDDVCRRISAISQVYESFFESGDSTAIDFRAYLGQCAAEMRSGYPGFRGDLRIADGGEPLMLGIEEAILAALVTAELVANALRFAYPEDMEGGEVIVSLRRLGGLAELSVRDSGVGMPARGLEEGKGIELVRSLAQQLHGTIEFRVNRGTEATLRFPVS